MDEEIDLIAQEAPSYCLNCFCRLFRFVPSLIDAGTEELQCLLAVLINASLNEHDDEVILPPAIAMICHYADKRCAIFSNLVEDFYETIHRQVELPTS